ncbi:hypothetical protein FKM82_010091 [Ascaphus truei]
MLEHLRLIKLRDTNHPVSKHFTECGQGGINNFSFLGIESVISKSRVGDHINLLDRREAYWIFTLQTRFPMGLNIDWQLTHFL